jgi:hypothetical protein
MKTAMQEHIEWLNATLDICKEHAPSLVNCLELCVRDAESRLEKEKAQIMDAYLIRYEGINDNVADEYYKETYESK